MSRLTEREIDAIRLAQAGRSAQRPEELSQARLAELQGTLSRESLSERLARLSGLTDVAWLLRHKVASGLARTIEKRRAARQLHGLSDHMLRDIGLQRANIDLVVDEVTETSTPAPMSRPGPIRRIGHWMQRRALAAQLHSLDDRMLSDIGICRGDIPGVVRHGKAVGQDARPANLSPAARREMAQFDVNRYGFVRVAAE